MMRALFYFIFIAGIGNTVLRPEMENPFTLYRLVAPLGLLAVFLARPTATLRLFSYFLLFTLYSFVLAASYSSDFSQFLPSTVHYLYLFILALLFFYQKAVQTDFDESFLRFVKWFYLFLLANLVMEMFFGSYYPNLYEDDSDDGSVRAFFWNQNDLAVVLCVIAWLALALDRYKGAVRVTVFVVTALLLYKNDSKAALISLLLVSLPIMVIFRICSSFRISPQIWAFFFGSVFMLVIGGIVALSDTEIRFATDTYTVGDLLVKPLVNILTLQDSGENWGSINNRTDAAIFVIIEYLRSYGFGLGAGGSWLVLTLPQYELGGAKSPHNALLQFVVDFGYPVVIGYAYLIVWAVRKLFTFRLGETDRLKVIAILSFPMLGLSQSGAILTNYFFFGGAVFIWMYGRPARFYTAAKVDVARESLAAHAGAIAG
ncbi:MAG: hypothetical protein RL684_2175 [Pseudomonadota bacterium]|jgi:hypothetical protein